MTTWQNEGHFSKVGNDPLVTILTASHNRAGQIGNLYFSLVKQDCSDFEWLIVNDGSTDKTEEMVQQWVNDNEINIRYFQEDNGGKHKALNLGFAKSRGKYIFIVDDDDWLEPFAISLIKKYDHKYLDRVGNDVAGFSFLRKYPAGEINVGFGRDNDYVASYNEVRITENRPGDMAEVYLSSILKQYSFPIFEGEKFLGEDVVWILLGKNFKLVFSNEAPYISDYQNDGLTRNRRKNNLASPKGCFYRAQTVLSIKKLPFILKCKCIMQLIIYGKFAGYSWGKINENRSFSNRLGIFLLSIPSVLVFLKWKKDNDKSKKVGQLIS